MTIEELIKDGKIKPLAIDKENISNALGLARRDISLAHDNLPKSSDWALNMAYNAALQSLRAFMFSKGYRPAGESGQHVAVLEFAELFLDGDLIHRVDALRRKRGIATYDMAGVTTDSQAERAISLAEELLRIVGSKVGMTST